MKGYNLEISAPKHGRLGLLTAYQEKLDPPSKLSSLIDR